MKLSVIVPVYFNEENLNPTYNALKENVFDKLDCKYELILVDDGSGDKSYEVMLELQSKDPNIRLVKLSRNFGSHAAILAGLGHSTGDCVTCISADLQDPPEVILEMLEHWRQGSKVVLGVRKDREESFFQKLFSNTYYALMRKFALPNMPKGGFDFFLIDRQVADILNAMEEKNTTVMGQILWCGFKPQLIYYVRRKREIGKSRWTFAKKIKLSVDSLLGFSYMPIRMIFSVGTIFLFIAVIWSVFIIVMKLLGKISITGWPTLIILNLFSFGVIMLTLGILGEYIWRVFDSVRNRPPFIVDETKERKSEEKDE